MGHKLSDQAHQMLARITGGVAQVAHHHALMPARQTGIAEPAKYPAHVRLPLRLAPGHTRRKRSRGSQKLFHTLDAIEALFLHVDHHVPMIDGTTPLPLQTHLMLEKTDRS